jgi:hypothetical protein
MIAVAERTNGSRLCLLLAFGHANEHPIVTHKRVVFAKEPEHALNVCRLDEVKRTKFRLAV